METTIGNVPNLIEQLNKLENIALLYQIVDQRGRAWNMRCAVGDVEDGDLAVLQLDHPELERLPNLESLLPSENTQPLLTAMSDFLIHYGVREADSDLAAVQILNAMQEVVFESMDEGIAKLRQDL